MFWFSVLSMAFGGDIMVSTLNIGHGRGSGTHQITQSKDDIVKNLEFVGAEIVSRRPDVLALQEADVEAWWSGNVRQSSYVATLLSMPHVLEGEHSRRKRLNYGTSLISQVEMVEIYSQSTPSTFPLPSKGFVIAKVEVEEQSYVVVSIHLDPIKASIRDTQIDTLVEELSTFDVPRIVMGDFNIQWGAELDAYCSKLEVRPYDPLNNHATFPKLNRRLDWILVSEELEFVEYQTHDVALSDHKLLSATVVVSDN